MFIHECVCVCVQRGGACLGIVLGGNVVHPAEVVVRLQELGQLAGKVFRVGQQLLYLTWETQQIVAVCTI